MARTKTKDAPATEPKWGARAKRRLADVKKDQGAQKAKTIEGKARDIAVKKEDRTIRLEYVYEAEGVKMPDGAHSHYGKPNGGSFKEGATTKRKSGTAAKTGTARKSGTAGQGNSRAAKRRTRKTAASAAGSQSPEKSKTDQMREQREQQAVAAEKNEPEKQQTPPAEEEPKTLA